MEGSRRGVAWLAMVLASCALTLGASGCGNDDSSAAGPGAVRTDNPERTFAPLIEVAAGEPWRPMGARWFVERSSLWFAEDGGCDDRKIAVGRTLPEQQNPTIDWIYLTGLGDAPSRNYDRNPYGSQCESDFDVRVYTDQLTRPYDPGTRVEGVRPGQGYYLDLADEARAGPAAGAAVPIYVERTAEGDSAVRLTYWVLFGMHGHPGQPTAHEGDWERIDVLLRADGESYEPRSVQAGGYERDTPWASVRRIDGTHPVVMVARATHEPTVAKSGDACANCAGISAWRSLVDARSQLWYGFGGAWGQPGTNAATTGPLGPHRFFSTAADKAEELAAD